MKERATFVQDIIEEGLYFFQAPKEYDETTISKKWKEDTTEIMTNWLNQLNDVEKFNALTIEKFFKSYIESIELGIGAVLPIFRVLTTGKGMGPSMFEIAELLGKEETIERMEKGIEIITAIKA